MSSRPSLSGLMPLLGHTPIAGAMPDADPRSRSTALRLLAIVVCAVIATAAFVTDATATTPAEINAKVEALSERIHTLEGKIARLQTSENTVQADLNQKAARQQRINAELIASRKRAAQLKRELRGAKNLLAERLVAVYKSGEPDLIGVVLDAGGFAQMIERATYLREVAAQDRRTINRVARLKGESARESQRLTALERDARVLVAEVSNRKDRIVGAKAKLTGQQGAMAAELRSQRRKLRAATIAIRPQPAPATVESFSGPTGHGSPSPVLAGRVTLRSDGSAQAPAGAPAAVKAAVAAGNQIRSTPYIWGGGHGSFSSKGYDCSGSVSYVLHAAGVLGSPLASGGLASWGSAGAGRWITVYANGGHAFMSVGGLWFDTSGRSGTGSRWQAGAKSTGAFAVRHWPGL